MLTRQERQEIAERAKACKKEEELNWDQFSYVLLGVSRWRNDEELLDRIVELCDTSNMIRLPLDKDGEVIRVGDTVANGADGQICRVRGYEFKLDDCSVLLTSDRSHIWTYSRPDTLTHKKLVTPELLSTQIRRVIDKGQMTALTTVELFRVVEQLESLSDKDE